MGCHFLQLSVQKMHPHPYNPLPTASIFFGGLRPVKKSVSHAAIISGNNVAIDMNESFLDPY